MSDDVRPDANQPEPDGPKNDADAAEEAIAAAASDTFEQASDSEPAPTDDTEAAGLDDLGSGEESPTTVQPGPAIRLERLQKILAQAGIASRRHAESLITEGRVQVNGKVVTELGTKADAARDHIRVDGKLLQGSERLRYFILNKPKGFVTTVSDPEGRPTVMQFFSKLRERLYPVGRLDYLSEGLLLVTNDGDLANKLTRAASGVEKTYLVKVSGEPSEEDLDRLRSGVGIERGKPGSGRVQTAAAQIRKVRQGDNPWYEVVIIEGRNRELRKMFEEIGHHVEKIRRVGYGPLVLDLEPGNIRELEAGELEDLRKAADGKLRKKGLKDIRRRKAMDAQLPTVKPTHRRPQPLPPSEEQAPFPPRREFPPKKPFGAGRIARPERHGSGRFQAKAAEEGSARFGAQRPGSARTGQPKFGTGRPSWKKDDRAARPAARFNERSPRSERPVPPFGNSARPGRPSGGFGGARPADRVDRPFEKRPWKKPDGDRPAFKHPAGGRREFHPGSDAPKPPRPSKLHIEAVEHEHESTFRPRSSRPPAGRPAAGRTPFRSGDPDRSGSGRGREGHGGQSRPGRYRPGFDRPRSASPTGRSGRGSAREFGGRPPRAEGDRSRPSTTSSGKPRAGGARPSNKRSGPTSGAKPAWKSKPGGAGRPVSGSRPRSSGSRSGGFSNSGPGHRNKSGSGWKPAGGRSSGKRPGGTHGGKKRG